MSRYIIDAGIAIKIGPSINPTGPKTTAPPIKLISTIKMFIFFSFATMSGFVIQSGMLLTIIRLSMKNVIAVSALPLKNIIMLIGVYINHAPIIGINVKSAVAVARSIGYGMEYKINIR